MGVFHVFKIVQMVPNHAKHHYLSRLCIEHKWFEEGMGYAPPKVLISTSGTELKFGSVITLNKRIQGDIIWCRRKKCAIYRLDIFFSITHMVQLMVPKINLFCQRDIRRYPYRDTGRKIPNLIPCQVVQKWQWLFLCDTWLRYLKKLQFMLTETRKISNLSQRCF